MIESHNIDELYKSIIDRVINSDLKSSPRGLDVSEVISPLITLRQQFDIPVIKNIGRKLNYAFQIIEELQYLDGTMDVERICWYNKNYRSFTNKITGEFDGAYGPRLN